MSNTKTAQVVCAWHALQHLFSVDPGSVAIVMLGTIFHLKSFWYEHPVAVGVREQLNNENALIFGVPTAC